MIIYFWPLGHFRIEGKKLDPFLVTKNIKNQNYQNMFLIFFNEKNSEGFSCFLTYKNDFEGQNCAMFELQFEND